MHALKKIYIPNQIWVQWGLTHLEKREFLSPKITFHMSIFVTTEPKRKIEDKIWRTGSCSLAVFKHISSVYFRLLNCVLRSLTVFKFWICISCFEALKGSASTLIFMNLRDKPCAEFRVIDIYLHFLQRNIHFICQYAAKSSLIYSETTTIDRLHWQLVRSECGGEGSELVGGFDVTFIGCRVVCELVICLECNYYPVDYWRHILW